jgi:hypothetical protein
MSAFVYRETRTGNALVYRNTQSSGATPVPTVTGITATPAAATVAGGSTTSIAIAVQGANNPGQGFTSSKLSGVGSITGGDATMPAATSGAQTGTFRFRSTQDTNFYVDVVLTVAAASQSGDTTRPVMVGAVTATATATSITASVPAATDNVGIKEYKWRINGGTEVSTGLTRTKSYAGLASETLYSIEVLAYDTSDNAALAPLTVDVVTLAASTDPVLAEKTLAITLKSKDLALRPNVNGINWAWSDARGVVTSSGAGLAANGAGQVLVPIRTALLTDGTGFLSLDNYNGGNPLDYFGFFGPVRVP